jgi:hypothetical protein
MPFMSMNDYSPSGISEMTYDLIMAIQDARWWGVTFVEEYHPVNNLRLAIYQI